MLLVVSVSVEPASSSKLVEDFWVSVGESVDPEKLVIEAIEPVSVNWSTSLEDVGNSTVAVEL